ncbi:MAG: sigma-70 family RNA polymerase sigma factor [Planctomycetota bacterium]
MVSEPPLVPIETLLQHERFVRSLVHALVADEAGAADAVQETWLAALEHPPRHRSRAKAWLARVAANIVRQAARRSSRQRLHDQAVAQPERLPSAAEIAEQLEAQRKAVEAVQGLHEIYRSVVYLHFLKELPIQEIAARLELPAATVRTRLRRSLAMLRDRLDEMHGGNRGVWLAALLPSTAGMDVGGATLGGAFAVAKGTAAALEVGRRTITMGLIAKWVGAAALIVAAIVAGPAVWESLRPTADLPLERSPVSANEPGPPEKPDPSAGVSALHAKALAPLPAARTFPSEDESSGTLHGSVVDNLREPLPGATVEVYRGSHEYDPSDQVGEGQGPIASVLADENGEFEISALPLEDVTVRVRKDGYTVRRHSVDLAPHVHHAETGRLFLFDARTLHGLVRGAEGKPLAGAWVLATSERRGAPFEPQVARTDSSGRFELGALPLGTVNLNVFAKDHAALQRGPFDPDVREVEIDLAAKPGAALHFVALESDGVTPVAGVRVSVGLSGLRAWSQVRMPYSVTHRTTDENGEATFETLPPGGPYGLSIRAENHEFPRLTELVLAAGEERLLELVALETEQRPTLSGTLRMSDGAACGGRRLRTLRGYQWTPDEITTRDDGSFEMTSPVPAGDKYYIWLEDSDYALAEPNAKAGYARLVATPGEPLRLVAASASRVRGRVVRANGEPVPSAEVWVIADLHLKYRFASRLSGPDGQFAFERLGPVPGRVQLKVMEGELPLYSFTETGHPMSYELRAGTIIEDVVIKVPDRARLSGTVVSADGSPAPGALVATQGHEGTVSDRFGRFVLDRLHAGEQTLLATLLEEVDYGNTPKLRVTLAAGEDRGGFEIKLPGDVREGEPGVIQGRVVWEDDSPTCADVILSRGQAESGFTQTDRSGRFRVEDLVDDVWDVHASVSSQIPEFMRRPGYPDAAALRGAAFLASDIVTVRPGSSEIVLRISRTAAGTLSGRFPDSPDFPVPTKLTAMLRRVSDDGRPVWMATVPLIIEGREYRMPPVSAGRVTLNVIGDTIQQTELEVEILPGKNTDLGVWGAEPAARITGYVTDHQGRPIEGAVVGLGTLFIDDTSTENRTVTTDATGRFELTAPLGYLEIRKDGYAPLSVDPSRFAGEQPQSVFLLPCGKIELINIPTALPQPIEWRLRVECEESDSYLGDYPRFSGGRQTSDWGVRHTIDDLPEGLHTVHFWHAGKEGGFDPPPAPERGKSYRWQLRVVAGETATIDVGASW